MEKKKDLRVHRPALFFLMYNGTYEIRFPGIDSIKISADSFKEGLIKARRELAEYVLENDNFQDTSPTNFNSEDYNNMLDFNLPENAVLVFITADLSIY